jgi:RNA polymerase sigma factor (TIGR02999 family)
MVAESTAMSDAARILSHIEAGHPAAADELLPLVYNELRKLAAAKLDNEKPGQTLHATDLVHETYVRLVQSGQDQSWNSRGHFFGAAAEAMRRILIDRARQKKSLKQGGPFQRQEAHLDELSLPEVGEDVLAIDVALEKLAQEKPLVARLVELRYFAGLSSEEAASILEISVRTAYRYWNYAKAWLHTEVSQSRSL